jgi:hypothetical protein
MDQAGTDQASARTFISGMERWEAGIQALKDGTGFASDLAPGVREQLVRRLQVHRQNVVTLLGEHFDAHPVASASTDALSDVDLSVRGDQAGANLMAAEAFLDGRYPGWREQYRLALMIDAGRIGTYAEAMEGLAPDARAAIQARVTREAETLTIARRLRNTESADREALLRELPAGTDVRRVRELAELGDDARKAQRDNALHEGDKLLARMRQATDPAERAQLAEQVTYHQMLANAMGDDAYISPGGVRRFVQGGALRDPHEQFQAAADQIEMAAHTVHEAGGVLEAMRRYEMFKYIRRFCDVVEAAGIDDPQLPFFKNWSETVYRLDRVATRDAARESISPEGLAKGWQEKSGTPQRPRPARRRTERRDAAELLPGLPGLREPACGHVALPCGGRRRTSAGAIPGQYPARHCDGGTDRQVGHPPGCGADHPRGFQPAHRADHRLGGRRQPDPAPAGQRRHQRADGPRADPAGRLPDHRLRVGTGPVAGRIASRPTGR